MSPLSIILEMCVNKAFFFLTILGLSFRFLQTQRWAINLEWFLGHNQRRRKSFGLGSRLGNWLDTFGIVRLSRRCSHWYLCSAHQKRSYTWWWSNWMSYISNDQNSNHCNRFTQSWNSIWTKTIEKWAIANRWKFV